MSCDKGIFELLPRRLSWEIERLTALRTLSKSKISELRIRRFGRSSFRLGSEEIELASRICEKEMEELISKILGEELYLHRESLASGYISLSGGVRVGVFGEARYNGGEFVGLSEITSVVFRIPVAAFDKVNILLSHYRSSRSGMLIYSPPGAGKTTALRTLAARIGSDSRENVAVIDERREFTPSDYIGKRVDILRGYKRSEGIEIAIRCASPSVVIVDEIGGEADAEAIYKAAFSGVRIIATAHAVSAEDVKKRKHISPLIASGAFDCLVGISALPDGQRTVIAEEEELLNI